MQDPTLKPDLSAHAFVRDLLPVYDLDFVRGLLLTSAEPYEFRQDIITALQRAIEAKVEKYPTASKSAGLKLLEKVSLATMKASNVDNTRQLMLAVAYRNIAMLERGLLKDPNDQGILIALVMTMEAEQDGEHWPNLAFCKAAAEKMYNHLKAEGIYSVLLQ